MAANPMYQFNVYRIGPEIKLGKIDIIIYQCKFIHGNKFTIAILLIFNLGSKKNSIIPNKIQLLI